MHGLMAGFRKLQKNGVVALRGLTFRRASSVLAVAGVMALAAAIAKDSDEKDAKSNGKQSAVNSPHDEAVAIPECLEKLKLSAEQQSQIKKIIESYNESLSTARHQFSHRYMQVIDLESQLLAAIEDNLTEPQRQQIRSHRQKTAKHENAAEAKNTKSESTTAKLATEVDEDLADVGITLTSEQQTAAEKVEEKYRPQFRSMKHDIESLHARLLSLSACKMEDIEKVLTKDQLSELRTHRQSAPEAKMAVTKN